MQMTVSRTHTQAKCVSCEVNELVQQALGNIPCRTADLIATGTLDSLALVGLILELESRFDVTFDYDTLELDSFRSVTRISSTIDQLRSSN